MKQTRTINKREIKIKTRQPIFTTEQRVEQRNNEYYRITTKIKNNLTGRAKTNSVATCWQRT